MNKLNQVLGTLAAVAVVGAAGLALWVGSGAYDISATRQHTQLVFDVMHIAMRQSVRLRARDIEPPDMRNAARLQRGALCFRDTCVQCHGAPGVAPQGFGLGMHPVPGPLVDAPAHWKARELYWITRHGIKMTGMPAWQHRLSEADLWAVVAFVLRLPALSPADYASTLAPLAGQRCERTVSVPHGAGDAARGRIAMHQHACNSCHVIPGLTGADVHVGPPLAGFASRQLIAGTLANTPDNLVRWILDPQAVSPHTAMPDLGVSESDARDMAAYLATLR